MSEDDRQRIHDLVTTGRPPVPVVLSDGPATGLAVDFYGEPWTPIRWLDTGLNADEPEPVTYYATGRFDELGRAIYTVDGRR